MTKANDYMIINNNSKCPDCGGGLKYYDKVARIVRTKGGVKSNIKLRRFKCVICNRLHREMPEFIFPYKHYESKVIKGVLEGTITPDTIGYEDYPCEMTMIRWVSQK